jgi:LysR family transcriptional regulator, hydrogen peroxide-inducible genes activator
MTITQMEYTVAVDKHGSFITAADKCHVTQPTLSMQIQKLEEELGIKIFDRNHHPIMVTEMGAEIIAQMRNALLEVGKVYQLLSNKKEEIKGKLNVGILPTIAPYLLPKILKTFFATYPDFQLQIFELHTEALVKRLKDDKLDLAIITTPLGEKELKETALYFEPYVAYLGNEHNLLQSKNIKPKQINGGELWTLNDEHCMQFQAMQLCDNSQNRNNSNVRLQYQTGTIASLVKMVENNGGVTIIPELCLEDFLEHQLENVRYFEEPQPVRQISYVTNKYFIKNKLAQAFIKHTLAQIPDSMKAQKVKQNILLPS